MTAIQVPGLSTITKVGLARQIYYNVRDFGAKGDNITDDTTALQAAISAAQVVGGTVLVPVGQYVSGTLTITKSISMLGEGAWAPGDSFGSRIIAKAGLNAHLIQFSPVAPNGIVGAYFRDLVFEGRGSTQTAGSIFEALGAIQCEWSHCHFSDPWDNGLHMLQDGQGGTGHQNRVSMCLFDNGNGSNGGAGRGLRMEASDENVVIGCDFENNGRAGGAEPHQLFDRSGLQTIIGNSFVGGQTGVKCEGSSSRIEGNIFDGVHAHNIRLNGNQHTIVGNTFYNVGNGGAANSISGVYVDNVSDALIVGNMFNPDGGGGAKSAVDLTSGTPTNVLVVGNTFTTSSGAWGSGALSLGSATGCRVANNRGWSPGTLTAPGIPISAVALANPFPYTASVYITGGTISIIAVGGTATGLTSGMVRVPAGSTLTLTYTAAPTGFIWIAE